MAEKLIYPSALESKPLQGFIKFMAHERNTTKESEPDKEIYLYMPESLNNPNTVDWSPESLGTLAGGMYSAYQNGFGNKDIGSAALDTLMPSVGQSIGSLAKKLLSSPASEAALGGIVTGSIPNPYMTMMFKGVNFRTFEFTFKLYPHNTKERDSIHKIIKYLRGAALPPGGGKGMSPAMLGYPKEFDIEYWFVDKDGASKPNKYLNKFKRSVIVGIETNYTGAGQFAQMRDGFPTEITLNLRFTELSIVLRDDVDNEDADGGY